MIIKNRKLIRRDDLGPIADYIDLDRLKADAEAAMLGIDDDEWYVDANHVDDLGRLFTWSGTSMPTTLMILAALYFSVEPLPADTTRLAEIDDEIARLTGEREKLMQGGTR